MTKKQARDSSYYEERLKRDHPTIYADLKAGKYRTVTDAAIAARLKTHRTRLHELKNAWSKADAIERDDFLRWLAGSGVTMPASPTAPTTGSVLTPTTVDRRLTTTASRRVEEIMSKRRLKLGDVMAEMGYPRLNPSLGMAVARRTRLKPDVIAALDKWLATNASV
ncbi:hypothetical protein [Rhizobium ruizarguesonis]|uniref:hypothetical protein n=1 Tax=Rhizobium ruizarguesonis TaxID=2081791 RepID=UPI0010323B7B|nr:hypothetical protein [Rhizobium ruizarguesonis]TBA18767.1 hypothetical protein ELH65_23920 [Rhizobium ruizarguesonis]